MAIKFMQAGAIRALKSLGITLLSGISEIIDNSGEAGSTQILIGFIQNNGTISCFVLDNGNGMDKQTLELSMTFGGEGFSIKTKDITDVGKFHVGSTVTMIRFSDVSQVFSKTANGVWHRTKLEVDELLRNDEIEPAEIVEGLPEEISNILAAVPEDVFSFNKGSGTAIIFNTLNDDLLDLLTLDNTINDLKYFLGERYFEVIEDGTFKISILRDNASNIEEVNPLNPLMTNEIILAQAKSELLAHFKYERIVTLRELDPRATKDISVDIEFTLIQKINKNDKLKDVPSALILNQENQGVYINRNWKLLDRALPFGKNKHNSLNGLRALVRVNATYDDVLGIRLNKSEKDQKNRFEPFLRERIQPIVAHLRKMLDRGKPIFENPPSITVGNRTISPIIIKSRALVREESLVNDTESTNEPTPNSETPEPPVTTPTSEHIEDELVNISSTPQSLVNDAPQLRLINEDTDTNMLLIFGAISKPEFEIQDLTNINAILPIDDNKYLIYDALIDKEKGLMIDEVKDWWESKGYNIQLDERLKHAINDRQAEIQRLFYDIYQEFIQIYDGIRPALLPEVYLNFYTMPYDRKQCVDFVLLLPNNRKVIIEIDGIQHYAKLKNNTWRASESVYTLDRQFDRQMTLSGFTVYRFSNYELKRDIDEVKKELFRFFEGLLQGYKRL